MSAPKIYCVQCEHYEGHNGWYETAPQHWCTVLSKEYIDDVSGAVVCKRIFGARLMRKLPWCNPKEKGE